MKRKTTTKLSGHLNSWRERLTTLEQQLKQTTVRWEQEGCHNCWLKSGQLPTLTPDFEIAGNIVIIRFSDCTDLKVIQTHIRDGYVPSIGCVLWQCLSCQFFVHKYDVCLLLDARNPKRKWKCKRKCQQQQKNWDSNGMDTYTETDTVMILKNHIENFRMQMN